MNKNLMMIDLEASIYTQRLLDKQEELLINKRYSNENLRNIISNNSEVSEKRILVIDVLFIIFSEKNVDQSFNKIVELINWCINMYGIENTFVHRIWANYLIEVEGNNYPISSCYGSYDSREVQSKYSFKALTRINYYLKKIYKFLDNKYPDLNYIDLPIENYYVEYENNEFLPFCYNEAYKKAFIDKLRGIKYKRNDKHVYQKNLNLIDKYSAFSEYADKMDCYNPEILLINPQKYYKNNKIDYHFNKSDYFITVNQNDTKTLKIFFNGLNMYNLKFLDNIINVYDEKTEILEINDCGIYLKSEEYEVIIKRHHDYANIYDFCKDDTLKIRLLKYLNNKMLLLIYDKNTIVYRIEFYKGFVIKIIRYIENFIDEEVSYERFAYFGKKSCIKKYENQKLIREIKYGFNGEEFYEWVRYLS